MKFSNSVVIASNDLPYSFIIPFFPETTRFIDFNNSLVHYDRPTAFNAQLRKVIEDPLNTQFFLLVNRNNFQETEKHLFGDQVTECERIRNSVVPLDLCGLKARPITK